jgi:hypothetical protein
MLFCKQLKEKFTDFSDQKTKPKQTQSNPNSERPKMNAYSFMQRTYDEISPFYRQKNKPKTKPISAKAKNEHKLIYYKEL